jgi:osmoprotectant transport system substrate-binding protein
VRFRRVVPALLALVIAGCGASPAPPPVSVAALPDAESALVAHLYAAALRFYGNAATVTAMPDPLTALDSADARVAPGFTGRVLQRFEPEATARADAQVYRDMVSSLPEGLGAGDYTTAAEDKPAVAVTEATAKAWDGRDTSALVKNCGKLAVGSVAGRHAPDAVGTCKLPTAHEYPDDATLFAALRAGAVNAAWTTTAAPDTPSELVVLADRTSLIRAENLVPLYRRNELSESQVLALNEIAGVLDTGSLADMRRQVAEGADPGAVADAWLSAHPLGR